MALRHSCLTPFANAPKNPEHGARANRHRDWNRFAHLPAGKREECYHIKPAEHTTAQDSPLRLDKERTCGTGGPPRRFCTYGGYSDFLLRKPADRNISTLQSDGFQRTMTVVPAINHWIAIHNTHTLHGLIKNFPIFSIHFHAVKGPRGSG